MFGDEIGVSGGSRSQLIGADVVAGEHACSALGVGEVFRCLTKRGLRVGGVVLAKIEVGKTGARHDALRIGSDSCLHLGQGALGVTFFQQKRGKHHVRGYVFVVQRDCLAELFFSGGRSGGIVGLQKAE